MPMLFGERFYGAPELVRPFLPDECARGRYLGSSKQLVRFATFLGMDPRQPRQRDGPRPGGTEGLLVPVQQDRIKPGGKAAGLVVIGQAFPCLDQRSRNKIFRGGSVAAQSERLPEQPSL